MFRNFMQRFRKLRFLSKLDKAINSKLYIEVIDTSKLDESFKNQMIVEFLIANSNMLYVTKEFKDGVAYGVKEDIEKVIFNGQFDTSYMLNNEGVSDKQKEVIDILVIDDNLGYLDVNTSHFKKKKIIILNKKV